MKRSNILLILMLMLSASVFSQGPVLINNVNYFDTELKQFVKGDVFLTDGKIDSIAPEIIVSSNYQIINGKDQYLIPGLVDAHIHLFQSGGLYTRPDAIDLRNFKPYDEERQWLKDNADDLLRRYLRLGITTVIDVGGPMSNYAIRDSFSSSPNHPNIYLTGPLISTYQPEAFQIDDPPIIKAKTKEEAVQMVKDQLPYKPDFIKIWYIHFKDQPASSTYDIVEAAIAESHKHNLKVAVHATQLETAKLAIKAGADILVHSVDDMVDAEFRNDVISKGIIYIPTLIVHGNYMKTFAGYTKPTTADLTWSNPYVLGSLYDVKNKDLSPLFKNFPAYYEANAEGFAIEDNKRAKNLLRMQLQGAIISTGTDAGNIGTLHATSYYDELEYMRGAGMSNAEILIASTLNGARVLNKEAEFGSIETGKTANLVLLNANPLKDLTNLQEINMVVKNGHVNWADQIIEVNPEDLAQQQLNAYNARDIEAFLTPYAEDVEVYTFPDKLQYKGKDKMRPGYAKMFEKTPELHCELVNRIVNGNTVIDQERVTLGDGKIIEATAIYEIKDGKIAKVWFVR